MSTNSQWTIEGSGRLPRFVLYSGSGELARQLGQVLEGTAVLECEPLEGQSAERVARLSARLLLLDFFPDPARPEKLGHAATVARLLAQVAPQVPRIAVGPCSNSEATIAALRAGVSDYVDPISVPQELLGTVQGVLAASGQVTHVGAGRCIAIAGARAGVGASTLAAHLSDLAHLDASREAAGAGGCDGLASVALVDLGWPTGDGQLYLNVPHGQFQFSDAVRNRHRLDRTLIQSALAHSSRGVAVLPLPRDPDEMAAVSHADCMALLDVLRTHFQLLIVDVGGFPHPEFVAQVAQRADQTWVVTDQSVGALVSLADLLQDFESRGVARRQLRLVLNRYDERYGMTREQIAQRFELEQIGALPDRTLALMVSMNQGMLLHQTAENDPYVRGLQGLLAHLGGSAQSSRPGWLSRWLPTMQKRLYAQR